MGTQLLCKSCAGDRQNGQSITTANVCRGCFEYATTEVGDLEGVGGRPEIRLRSEPFDLQIQNTTLPKEAGKIVDISPLSQEQRSIWLLLAEDGQITQFDADTRACKRLAHASFNSEPDHEPWCGHHLRRRLYASPGGDFVAIVNDYGRYGQIIDLRSGQVTLALDGGDYHHETVPLSFAFAQFEGRVVAVHRTAWNRLDVSDPSTGKLLTARHPTSYQQGGDRPAHYLDYFHGALHISPNGFNILDDGWGWHPVGIPRVWSLEPWVSDYVWES